jgi:hypothetical protein
MDLKFRAEVLRQAGNRPDVVLRNLLDAATTAGDPDATAEVSQRRELVGSLAAAVRAAEGDASGRVPPGRRSVIETTLKAAVGRAGAKVDVDAAVRQVLEILYGSGDGTSGGVSGESPQKTVEVAMARGADRRDAEALVLAGTLLAEGRAIIARQNSPVDNARAVLRQSYPTDHHRKLQQIADRLTPAVRRSGMANDPKASNVRSDVLRFVATEGPKVARDLGASALSPEDMQEIVNLICDVLVTSTAYAQQVKASRASAPAPLAMANHCGTADAVALAAKLARR